MVGTSRILDIAVLTAKDQGLAKVRGGRAARVGNFQNAGAAAQRVVPPTRSALPLTCRRRCLQAGDYIVAVHGAIDARPGSTNLVKVVTVE